MPHSHTLRLGLASVCLALWSGAAAAATWTAEVGVTVERTTEVTGEGTTHTDTFDQSYALSYETQLFETLDFTLDFTLDVDQETKDDPPGSPAYTTRDSKPSVEATLVSQWWDLFGSWDETKTTSTKAGDGRTVESNWEFEAVVEPEHDLLPAFRYNVTGGNDDVIDKDVDFLLEYSFLGKLDASLGLSRETSDGPEPDSDTDGRTIEVELGLSHELTRAILFEADWSMDRDQALTLSDEGEILAREDLLANDLRGMLEWNILEMVTTRLEREVQWDKDLELDNLEVTDTWTGEVEVDRDLTEALHLNLTYTDEREDARPLGAHTYTITRDYTAELAYAPFEWLTVTPSFERNDKTAWSNEPDSETDDTRDDTYELLFEYSLWGDFLVLDVTRTWEYSWEKGTQIKQLRAWDVNVEALPLYVPNLEVTPTYSYTEDVDTVAGTSDEEKTIEVDFGYEINLRDRLVLRLDHTYSRKQTWSSDAAMTIERTDDTEVTITWDEFVRGMGLELSWARDASLNGFRDAFGEVVSEKGPEIDYTYTVTYDWEILANYTVGFEYNRDVKQESEDTQNFTTTLTAEFFDGRMALDFEHEFDEQLEGERTKTHRYLIELRGEF